MHWDGWVGVIATIASACYAIWSEYKRGTDRATMHRFLIGLKPWIQGPNQASVLKAIDNTLEWLQPPKKRAGRSPEIGLDARGEEGALNGPRTNPDSGDRLSGDWAPVSSLITEVGKWRERQSRREELLLTKAIEMGQSRVSNVRESSVEPILRRLRQRKEPSYTGFN